MQLKIRQTTDKKKEINFHSRIFDFPCSSRKEVILRSAQKGVREIRQLKALPFCANLYSASLDPAEKLFYFNVESE